MKHNHTASDSEIARIRGEAIGDVCSYCHVMIAPLKGNYCKLEWERGYSVEKYLFYHHDSLCPAHVIWNRCLEEGINPVIPVFHSSGVVWREYNVTELIHK